MSVNSLFDKRNKPKSKRKSISKIAKILKNKKSNLDLISTRSGHSTKKLFRDFDTFSNNSKDIDLTSNASFQTINSSKTTKSKMSKISKRSSKRRSKVSKRSSKKSSKRRSKNSEDSKRSSKKPKKNLIKLEPMTTEQYNNYFEAESEVKEISVNPKEPSKKKKNSSKDLEDKLDLTQNNQNLENKVKQVTIVPEENSDKKPNKPQRIYTEEEILNCMNDTTEVKSIDDLELNDKICYFTTDQDGNKGFRKGGIIQKIYKPFREGDSYKILIRNKLGLSWCVKWDKMTSCYKHNKNGKISEENKKIREELKKIKKNYKEQSILVASLEETLKSHTKTINYLVSKLG